MIGSDFSTLTHKRDFLLLSNNFFDEKFFSQKPIFAPLIYSERALLGSKETRRFLTLRSISAGIDNIPVFQWFLLELFVLWMKSKGN